MTILSSAFLRSCVSRTVLIAMAVAISNPAFADSSFRGFTVSDTPDQVDNRAKAEGVTVSWGPPVFNPDGNAKQATIKDGDNACGWITFNGDQKIESMLFASCFFGGEGLGIRQVTQAFIDRFGGSAEMEIIPDPMCKDAQPLLFKGRTSEGEQFRIKEDCARWKLEVMVEIKPGSGKGLKF
ncbi:MULTISPECIES: hypothetical protein [unclassified Mesorhizobium]|uniref:hypothetical protein n=1 Tax=unclassified Mesorhizobium TaxID=325217 RepID=UPI001093105D|nr:MULTISPECIES: hypothetical protein [unclassified Mesorhizobium]TGQ27736.1 hypothetical protein EN857_32575 [Mesorhizobium sp. M4B.F.Ca.ET.214.01.1.1]TGQ54928.1 hypothetical protein EN854_32460 [Mesorhizobium sp. M4B.F.Ca.ET.211.01.1.1]TGU28327.1 hypothetical protein EN793_32420 [Mesorhizobium sp. M4B.F.Ca.ET.150.01.1.1]